MSLPPFAVIADAHILDASSTQCQHLQMALAHAAARGSEFAVLAGDLVREGRRPAFDALTAVLDQSPIEWFTTCGNRDLYYGSTQPYRRLFGTPHRVVFRAGYRLVLLDGHAPGLDAPQRRWLAAALSQTAPHSHTVVIGHHYLSLFPERERNAFLSICRRYGVRDYISAHRHLNRRVRHPALTEHIVGAIDPDKAVAGPPCYLLAEADGKQLRTSIKFVTIPRHSISRHLLDQLGVAPARWGSATEICDLAQRLPMRWYQLRIAANGTPASILDQAEAARGCGMQLVGHLPTPLLETDGTLGNRRAMDAAVGVCLDQDVRVAVLHPPKLDADIVADHHGRLRIGSPAVTGLLDNFTSLVTRMESAGIHVTLENNSSKRSATAFGSLPEHIAGLISRLAERGMQPGFCFDVGHAKASVANAQVGDWMGRLGHRLGALHLHTGNPHTRVTHSPIDELYGRTQWYGIAAWLAWLRVEAPCLLEVRTPDDALRSGRMLRRLVDERPTPTVKR